MYQKRVLLGVVTGFVTLALVGVVHAATTAMLTPTGVGTYNQFSTTGTSTRYLNVDESTCNGTTDYNFTTTVGQRDSYAVNISSIPNTSQITSVAIKPCASRNTGNKAATMNVFYVSGGFQSGDMGGYAVTGTTPIELATTTFVISPTATSAIKTSLSTLEIGAVYTSGTGGVRLSRIATVVGYNLFNAPTALSATSNAGTTTTVSLNWTDNTTFESAYAVERSTDAINFVQIASTSPQATSSSYVDGTVSSLTTYYYRVKAYNAGGYSGYSNTATTTTP